MKEIVLIFLWLFLSSVAFGQNFRLKEYTIEDGLPQNFIYTVNQDKHGYLWVGTGDGLARFDGNEFESYTTADGLADNLITASSFGKTEDFWIGHNNGQLSLYHGSSFEIIKHPNAKSTVTSIAQKDSKVYFTTLNEGLFEVTNKKVRKLGKFGANRFNKVVLLENGQLLLATNSGLLHLTNKNGSWVKNHSYNEENEITTFSPSKNEKEFLYATESGNIFRLDLSVKTPTPFEVAVGNFTPKEIRSLIQTPNGDIWIGTNANGVMKIAKSGEITIYNNSNGLSGNSIRTILSDREGGIWIGTFGDGLSYLSDDYFTFYTPKIDDKIAEISMVHADSIYRWYGTNQGLLKERIDQTEENILFTKSNGFTDDLITSFYHAKGKLYIGTENSGLFYFDYAKNQLIKNSWNLSQLNDKINQITGNDDYLWLATRGGLVAYDYENGETTVYGTESGLPHNSILSVFNDSEGNIWVGTISRSVLKISDKGTETVTLSNSGQLKCTGIIECPKGVIWVSTSETGVYRIKNDKVDKFTTNEGMASDFTYGIIADIQDNIWVAHRNALSRISVKNQAIRIYDRRSGIRGKITTNALSKDASGFLWIGTELGAIRYDISKDFSKRVPPIVNLKNVWINGVRYDANKKIELPYGNYRIRFEYAGISFRNQEEITYQYILEGYESTLSPATNADFASYGSLSYGEYVFKVLATNGQGTSRDSEATIQIFIARPFWEKTWFFVLVIIAGIFLVYIVVKMRTSRLEKAKLKLENQLEIKTREVVEKASRIASINKDLTDSINYAERIQKSILPSEKSLSGPLPGSFLFFQPRDIVSGDFYFIQQFDNKLIVACGDCTGHGVPGALVSMIGSVTLRNIYTSQKTVSKTPDQILEQLDHDIKEALHKGIESDLHNYLNRDGMDIVLAEIDLNTNEVLLASAKRHWIVFADGKQKTFKGDSRSIGDLEGGETPFSLHRFKMEKGSSMYLFSDGYTDQFGGENDKKFKLSGTRKTIQRMNDSNTDQYTAVSDAFNSWKGDAEQVDDVLFIGLRF